MKCINCGSQNREEAKFCLKCGAELKLVCPQCSRDLPGEAQFCDECGHHLKQSSVASVDYSRPSSYTPGFLADKILTSRCGIEGERKIVTVFFADVAGFTTMSEKLDPEDIRGIMDGCFRILMDQIHKYEGTITQFLGDGLMALFGAPVAHEDHARRACLAAYYIQQELKEYDRKIRSGFGIEFKMRIGLNSGLVTVGTVGNDLRMDYTAVGDTVNLASRMESSAEKGAILISENTHRLIRNYFEFKSRGKVQIKGKKEPQPAYELICPGEIETRIGVSVAKGLTRFVGRQNALAKLKEAFEKSKAGSGQIVGVVGEAGVGKSRLLLEFIGQLPEGKITHLHGQCRHFGGAMAYLPILDIIRSYCGIQEGKSEASVKASIANQVLSLDEDLKSAVPPLCELLSVKTDDEAYLKLEPRVKKDKTLEALRDLFISESRNRPLILVIEDLHWMDNTSQEFISYLIDWLAGTQILLILLYRPEYTHPWGSKSYYNRIGLEQLNSASSAELVNALLEEGEVPAELKNLILGRAAGNPLFMEEFTHTLLENGTIEKQDERYVVKGNIKDIQVPDTVQGIIAARMDRLEDTLKRTLQVASVIGRDFAFRILHIITDRQDELKTCLLNLQGLEFIHEKQLFPELEYIFKHALTQEVAYNSLLMARRKEIHQRIGQAVEELYTDRLHEFFEVLAYHYSKAENREKAYQYLKLSGEKTAKNCNHREAIIYLNQALDNLEQMAKSNKRKKEQLAVRLLMVKPLQGLGYPENTLELFGQGVELAEDLGNIKARNRFSLNLSYYHALKGDWQLAMEYPETLVEKAKATGDLDTLAAIASGLCLSYLMTSQYQKLVDLAPYIIALIENSNRTFDNFGTNTNPYSFINAYYADALFLTGNIREAKRLFEKIQPFAAETGELTVQSSIGTWHGHLLTEIGELEAAKKKLQHALDLAEKEQVNVSIGDTCLAMGYFYYHQGEFERARFFLNRSIEIQHNLGNPSLSYRNHYFLFLIYLDENDLDRAEACAHKVKEHSRKNRELSGIALSKILLGEIQGLKNPLEIEAAGSLILEGVDGLKTYQLKFHYPIGYLFIGELYAKMGRKETAMKYLKIAEGLYQELEFAYWLKRTRTIMNRL